MERLSEDTLRGTIIDALSVKVGKEVSFSALPHIVISHAYDESVVLFVAKGEAMMTCVPREFNRGRTRPLTESERDAYVLGVTSQEITAKLIMIWAEDLPIIEEEGMTATKLANSAGYGVSRSISQLPENAVVAGALGNHSQKLYPYPNRIGGL